MMCMSDYVIEMLNITKEFPGVKALDNVSFQVRRGEIKALVGENGAGKSTFLKILSGEIDFSTGEVSITPGTRMSILKQDHYAYDAFTVLDTIIMGNARLYEIMKQRMRCTPKRSLQRRMEFWPRSWRRNSRS